MIISRTPFRVSLAGGGSDLKEFYSKNGYGAVLSTAIKKYMYIIIHPYFNDKIRIKYSKVENVKRIDEIKHPIVRECLKRVNIRKGIEIASLADVPAGTGLGSSSAFTVGLLNALYAYQGKFVSRERLAEEACDIEINILEESIGKQDQYAVALGGVNYIKFNKDETVDIFPVVLTKELKNKFEDNFCLYYPGGTRRADDILKEQINNINQLDKYENLKKIVGLAEQLRNDLNDKKTDKIGEILNAGWLYKKQLAKTITNNKIDILYEDAIGLGAAGGKLLGAGGSGFLLLYSDNHVKLKKHIKCKTLDFGIDTEGTKIIFYE